MKFDLHMHSYYSNDGEFSPYELIQKAKAKNLQVVALSDHNAVAGIDEMIDEGSKEEISVIPTVECDTKFEGYEVHVLAYNIDHHAPYFTSLNKKISKLNFEATRERFELFEKYFQIKLDIDRLLDLVGEKGKMIDALVDILQDERYQEIDEFQPFLPGGEKSDASTANFYWEFCFKGAPCFVDIDYPSLADTVKEIHKAGGIAVLAHPWRTFYQNEELLHKAISQEIDGIEAYSNYHSPEQNEYYEEFCKVNQVLITCGSDFHGKTKPKIELGEYGYVKDDSDVVLKEFLKRISK